MRVLAILFLVLALAAVTASAGVAPERAAVNPAAGDPVTVRPADPVPMDRPANHLAGPASRATPPPMSLPVDGTWFAANCFDMQTGPDGQGGWMSDPDVGFQVSSPWRIVILAGDVLVVGDRYQIWVDGAYAGRTGRCLDDGSVHGMSGIDQDYSLLEQSEGCAMWNLPDLSSGVVVIPPGTHTVQIKCYRFASGYATSSCILKAEERWARCPMEMDGVPTMMKIGAGEESTSWGELKTLFR